MDTQLHQDDRTSADFANLFQKLLNFPKAPCGPCYQHKGSATSNMSVIDWVRFLKRDYLEHRGNLSFYAARLSDFLWIVGLDKLGRIEQ